MQNLSETGPGRIRGGYFSQQKKSQGGYFSQQKKSRGGYFSQPKKSRGTYLFRKTKSRGKHFSEVANQQATTYFVFFVHKIFDFVY